MPVRTSPRSGWAAGHEGAQDGPQRSMPGDVGGAGIPSGCRPEDRPVVLPGPRRRPFPPAELRSRVQNRGTQPAQPLVRDAGRRTTSPGGPTCKTLPRSITAKRWANAWASVSSCATRTSRDVAPGHQVNHQVRKRSTGGWRPPVYGSSSNNASQGASRRRPRATRWAWPPDSRLGMTFSRSPTPSEVRPGP